MIMNEDMVPRTSIQSLNGLLESLILALARCRLSTLRWGYILAQALKSHEMCMQCRTTWLDQFINASELCNHPAQINSRVSCWVMLWYPCIKRAAASGPPLHGGCCCRVLYIYLLGRMGRWRLEQIFRSSQDIPEEAWTFLQRWAQHQGSNCLVLIQQCMPYSSPSWDLLVLAVQYIVVSSLNRYLQYCDQFKKDCR